MGLDLSCEKYLNQLLLVKPIYGWGWSRQDVPQLVARTELNELPPPFICRPTAFFYFEDELSGMVAEIEDSCHIYDGLWTFSYLAVRGTWNFTNEVGRYH